MDVNGGQLAQTNGNPIWPGTLLTGPILAGNVFNSDGTGNLAAVGEQSGSANVGYVQMAQAEVITQATNGSVAGVWTSTQLIIPAQSLILGIQLRVTTAWTGSFKTLGVGIKGTATYFTAAGAGDATTRGFIEFSPGTDATAIGHWDNVGTSDVAIMVTSTNTGSGVGTLVVRYVQGCNMAS